MFGGEVRPHLICQRQHERAAHQKMRIVLGDEQQRQALMPVPTGEEAQGAVRGAAGAEGAAEAEDGNAVDSAIARETQQSLPPLRKQCSAAVRRPAPILDQAGTTTAASMIMGAGMTMSARFNA